MGRASVHVQRSKEDGGAFSSTPPSHPLPPASSDADEINLADQCAAIERLFEERLRIGMHFWDWEEKSGVSVNSAYAWRTGSREPTLGNLVALATVLGFEIILKKRVEQ